MDWKRGPPGHGVEQPAADRPQTLGRRPTDPPAPGVSAQEKRLGSGGFVLGRELGPGAAERGREPGPGVSVSPALKTPAKNISFK